MQFGVRWGRELALFESLRTTFEPFNHSRKIIGFDTFSGYQGVDAHDGTHRVMEDGNLSTSENYRDELEAILSSREQMSPIPQVKKFELIEGNAEETLAAYLKANPHTIIPCEYFTYTFDDQAKTLFRVEDRNQDREIQTSGYAIDSIHGPYLTQRRSRRAMSDYRGDLAGAADC